MHATPTRASATPATPSTILVPETPLTAAGNRTIATHYGPRNATAQPQSQAQARRTQTRTHQPPTTPQLNPSLSNPRTELQHLRTRRADLTDRLNESTSHISRLQLRQRLQAHELLRERAVAGRATADRKVLEAGRDEGVTAAIAEARERAMRQGIVNGRLRALLIILFLAVAGYAAWCYVNQASFRYIRGVEERRYGL
ncbi:hypothetical protein B0A55_06607 [Friedmanniomyces simplex]|uniref:Uncharacterized protein n=1 Tax=Friedmanniomyces simplex TaxID=329884 RepID=A0A4U0WYQ4_9PEZI|nr:hypothetical protein B0A55_06607 [Friedmanniomyces simplex]